MSQTPISDSPRAQKTLAVVREAIATGRVPVVTHVMELIRAITAKADTISIQQLGDIIGRDPGTMARLISIANRLGYNHSGVEIATIHQAISVIGFERIRNLAISVMLMENAESQMSVAENHEVAAMSLASGLLATELMQRSGAVDPEIAFVCAALRNYGKLLMTTFLIEQYQQAKTLAESIGADAACREVFGLTPLELGRELLESEQLPRVILDSMQHIPREALLKEILSPQEHLVGTAEFAVKVFELFDSKDLDQDNFELRAVRLAREHVPGLKLSAKDLLEHMKAVDLRCAEIAGQRGSGKFTTPLLSRLEALAAGRRLPPPLRTDRRRRGPPSAQALRDGGEYLGHMLQQNPNDITRVFVLFNQVLGDALHLKQSVIFLRKPGTHRFVASYGEGSLFETLQGHEALNERNHDVFGLCLSRGEDIFIQDANDPRIVPFIPPWLSGVSRGYHMILLALRDDAGSFGLVLGISRSQEAFDFVRKVTLELREIRAQLASVGRIVRNAKA